MLPSHSRRRRTGACRQHRCIPGQPTRAMLRALARRRDRAHARRGPPPTGLQGGTGGDRRAAQDRWREIHADHARPRQGAPSTGIRAARGPAPEAAAARPNVRDGRQLKAPEPPAAATRCRRAGVRPRRDASAWASIVGQASTHNPRHQPATTHRRSEVALGHVRSWGGSTRAGAPRRRVVLSGVLTARFGSHGAGRRLRFGWTRRWSKRRIIAMVTIASETSGSAS